MLLGRTLIIVAGPFHSGLSLFFLVFNILTRSPGSKSLRGSAIQESCCLLYLSLFLCTISLARRK